METKFTPIQLKNDFEFLPYKDLITAITNPKQLYSKNELRELLKKTLTKEVD